MSTITKDVAVYGDHPAAINAAIEVARAGRSVVLFTPEKHLGAPYASGLQVFDLGKRGSRNLGEWTNKEFLNRVNQYMGETKRYRRASPLVAEQTYIDMLKHYGVTVLNDTGITSVSTAANAITGVVTDTSHTIVATNYIDGSEDGDLAAGAGCTMTVGRESAAAHGESLAGVMRAGLVPFDTSNGSGGYIFGIEADHGLSDGAADPSSQQMAAFRLCVTNDPHNQRQWPKPAGYDPDLFEFRLRSNDVTSADFSPFNTRDHSMYSKLDLNGDDGYYQVEWATATKARRNEITTLIYNEVAGWYWFLANDSSVHSNCRTKMETYRPCIDEFMSSDLTSQGWPYQIYRRGTRRLTNPGYMMTQNDMKEGGSVTKTNTIATGHYNMDFHPVRRLAVTGGYVNDTARAASSSARHTEPYEIDARCMYTSECTNLLVPNCMGATFVAYASMRIDFWKANMGSVAGLWAARSVIEATPIQSYSITTATTGLQARIEALGGIIHPV
jgi:hypothetical protein